MTWKILWGCISDGPSLWFGVSLDFFDSEEWLTVSQPKESTGNSFGRWWTGCGYSRRDSHCSVSWPGGSVSTSKVEDCQSGLCVNPNFWTEGKGTGPWFPKLGTWHPACSLGTCLSCSVEAVLPYQKGGLERWATEPNLWLWYLVLPWVCLSPARGIRLTC